MADQHVPTLLGLLLGMLVPARGGGQAGEHHRGDGLPRGVERPGKDLRTVPHLPHQEQQPRQREGGGGEDGERAAQEHYQHAQ